MRVNNKILIGVLLIVFVLIVGCGSKKADTDGTQEKSDDLEDDLDNIEEDLGVDDFDELSDDLDEIDSLDY